MRGGVAMTVRRSSLARRTKDSTRQVAGLARALGHPARIRIVRTLIDKQACIGCDLVDEIGLAQSTVSEHLRILKAAGIITGDTGPVTPVRGHTRPRTLDYAA
jgi:ArsR family transcriptional regulator